MRNSDQYDYDLSGTEAFLVFLTMLLILGHLFMVVFTVGHMANNKHCSDSCQFATTLSLMPLGIGWPFYWSFELQRHD